MTKPGRGEVWLVRFDPSCGAEIQKLRPAVVVQEDELGRLPLSIVVPITDWKEHYSAYPWHTKLVPSAENGLEKASSADSLQVKSVSHERFVKRVGDVRKGELDNIVTAVALCIGFR